MKNGPTAMVALALLLPLSLTACQPSKHYIPQTEEQALAALDKAADERLAPVDRIAWADAAIRSNLLQRGAMADAYYYRGDCRHRLNQFDLALRDMEAVIRILPDDGDAYGGRGTSLHALGYYDDAIADYQAAYRLTRNREYLNYVRMAQEDKRTGRPPAGRYDPGRGQPTQPAARRYSLVFEGFYAERLQRDSIVNPDNEACFVILMANKGEVAKVTSVPKRGAITGIKKGQRRKISHVVWTGSGDQLQFGVTAWEHDNGGPAVERVMGQIIARKIKGDYLSRELSTIPKNIFGTGNDMIGYASLARINPANNLANGKLSRHDFKYHLATTLTGGGARYHLYFSFMEAD